MSEHNPDVERLIAAIRQCTAEKTVAERQYAQRLHSLKIELARACGHSEVRYEWAWGQCMSCGITELASWFRMLPPILAVQSGMMQGNADRKDVAQ